MKKLLILTILVVSCNSSKSIVDKSNLGVFTVENIEGNLILLTKKSSSLKTDGEVEEESAYTIEVPLTLKEIKSIITVIPNRNELIFDSNQKVLIFGSSKGSSVDKTGLLKDDFIIELNKNHIANFVDTDGLHKNRYFGIYKDSRYVLIYLNVKKENITVFNSVIKSQKFGNISN